MIEVSFMASDLRIPADGGYARRPTVIEHGENVSHHVKENKAWESAGILAIVPEDLVHALSFKDCPVKFEISRRVIAKYC